MLNSEIVMLPQFLWITITHVLLWNFIFCLSEGVELNKDGELLRDRVRCSTQKCNCLKNTPPGVDYDNYEPLTDSDGIDHLENPNLANDLSEPSYPVKRHVILRCHNHPARENNKPYKPDLITSEWKMKSIPVNNEYIDSMVKKSKVVGLKKIDINSQKVYYEPLHHTLPLLHKVNLIGKNPKHSLLELNLHDKTNQIKSLVSTPQHKLDEIVSDKLFDETIHNKQAQPSLTLPLPYKLKNYQLIRPTEIYNNIDTAGLITDSDKQSDLLKLSPLSLHTLNNQEDLKNKPFSTFPSTQCNKPKPADISLCDRSPSQLKQTPVIKPIHLPILVQKEVPLSSANERPQDNIDSLSQYPKIIKNGITESTSQPILIKKYASMSLSHKKQQESIDLPPTQYIKTSDTDTANKPIKIEKEVSISAPNEQKQPIVDLSPQAPQIKDS